MVGGHAGKRGGAELGVEDAPDRWAPPVGDHVREREGSGALAGLLGRKRGAGPLGDWAGKEMGRRWKKKTREERWAAGLGREDGLFVCSFVFLLFFKSFSNLFFKLFFKKTTSQPKLKHFNMMHKHLGDSNY
jgi:hypothetical protein